MDASATHPPNPEKPLWLERVAARRARPSELKHPATGLRTASNGVAWLKVPAWQHLAWLWHGFSTRRGGLSRAFCAEGEPGELNVSLNVGEERATVGGNRRLLAEAITGSQETPIFAVQQIHSAVTVEAQAARAGLPPVCEADGLMTAEPGFLLAVQTADCVPVLVADTGQRVVAAFHAGWRGTVQQIAEKGVERMRREHGSRPEDLVAAVGPAIGPCCYAIGEEVYDGFSSRFAYATELFYRLDETGPALHLDLHEANRRQLLAAGLRAESIHLTRGCTCCQQDLFFSHRGGGGHAGRMMSVIGIKP